MSYLEGTMGAMLQGVSQQPARLRAAGQVSEQINYDSDVSVGLTSRPGTTHISYLYGSTTAMEEVALTHAGNKYIVGYASGELALWKIDGTPITVSFPDGTGYIGNDMVFQSDEGEKLVKCLNRDKIVEMDTTIEGEPFNAVAVSVLGGLFLREYKLTLISEDGDEETVSFTTPDGTQDGDAEATSADTIANELGAAWLALVDLPAKLATVTVTVVDSTLLFRNDTPLDATVSDGEGGTTLRIASSTVKDITYLPVTTAHGHTVLVQESRSVDDDYYLRFYSDTTSVFGDGFGSSGVWREIATPDEPNEFDLSTMPHQLVIDATANTAVFSETEWLPRKAGNNLSNPVPVFVGNAIRDLGVFEGRTVTVSSDTVRMSRSDETLDMWKGSATVDTDADPIEIKSTSTSGARLDWIVPFDGDLLLVSDPGAAQFVIKGGGLTPSNASMVLSTEYEVDGGVRPVSTGRTVILPFKTGSYVGLNEFFTQDTSATNAADALTAVQDRYITGSITNLQAAENFSRVAVGANGDTKTLWVYRYLWDGNSRLQSAWYKHTFTEEVRMFFFDSSSMYVVLRPANDEDGSVLVRMDMNRVEDAVGFHVTLDRKTEYTVSSGEVVVDFANAMLVQSTGCESPGLLALIEDVVDNMDGTYTITPDPEQCPNGATVILGHAVARALEPTMPVPRNGQNEVASRADLMIRHFLIHMSQSGDIKAVMDSPYRGQRELCPRRVSLDDDPLDPNRRGIRDYVMDVPWREQTNKARLTLESTDIRPDTILEIEWAGDIRGVRRRI